MAKLGLLIELLQQLQDKYGPDIDVYINEELSGIDNPLFTVSHFDDKDKKRLVIW